MEAPLPLLENDLDKSFLPEGTTPLHIASGDSTTTRVSLLLDRCPESIHQLDRHGRTPLAIALQKGRFDVACLLIEAGAHLDVEFASPRSLTTTLTITEELFKQVYQPLIAKLVFRNVKLPLDSLYLRVLFHSAAFEGDDNLLKRLLDSYEVDVDSKDALGNTALHYASQSGHVSVVETLLKYGATVSSLNSTASTSLHIVCARGDLTLLNILLQDSVSKEILSIPDALLRTCAHVALYRHNFQVLQYLMAHFRSFIDFERVDHNGHTLPGLLFLYRISLGLIPPALSLEIPLLTREEASWYLHSAVYEGALPGVQKSLPMASLDVFDHMQHTPLMLAAKLGHLEICKLLVKSGADPNLADHARKTPLQCACDNKHYSIVSFLFSLHTIDPALFFDTFSRPLSSPLLKIILGYFDSNVSPPKPAHWQKWLSLAVGNNKATEKEFSKLVNKICPLDWLQILARGSYNYSPVSFVNSAHPCLPLYTEENSAELEEHLKTQAQLSFCGFREAKKKVVFFENMKPPPPNMLFKKLSSFNKNSTRKGNQIQRKERAYFPVHEAASTGNCAVLDFILDEAKSISASLPNALLLETENDCKQTVVELMARNLVSFKHKFDSSLMDLTVKKYSFFSLKSMVFEEALLHSLLTSNESTIVVHASEKWIPSSNLLSWIPLAKWPFWYSNLRLFVFLRDIKFLTDEFTMTGQQHLSKEERSRLVLQLLETCNELYGEAFISTSLPDLLSAAVKYKCLWGVELMATFGASTSYDLSNEMTFWSPLYNAALTCQTEMIKYFQVSPTAMTHSHFEALNQALLVLAKNGHTSTVEELYRNIVSKSNSLWTSRVGPRLIYLLMSHDLVCSDAHALASQLARDMVTTVVHIFLTNTQSELKHSVLRMIDLFSCMSFMFGSPFQKRKLTVIELTLSLVTFIKHSYASHSSFFHSLFSSGSYNLVNFVIENTTPSDLQSILLQLDSSNMSPLYKVALVGRIDIARLLIDKGCAATHPDSTALPELLASLLFLRKQVKLRNRLSPSDLEFLDFFTSESDIARVKEGKHFLDIMKKISKFPSLTPFDCLLGTFLDNLNDCTLKPKINKLNRIIQALPLTRKSSIHSVQLFDNILLKYVDWNLSRDTIFSASKKGLWGIVEKSLLDLSLEQSDKYFLYSHILSHAVVQNQHGVVSSLCKGLCASGALLPRHLQQPLCTAVKSNSPDLVKSFLEYEVDVFPPLICAIRLHYNSIIDILLDFLCHHHRLPSPDNFLRMLKIASHYNNKYAIEQLLIARFDVSLSIDDDRFSFWFQVLTGAAEYGHESLTLLAIGSLSENQLKCVEKHDSYLHILNWCCYWGMKDTLDCLPFSSSTLLKAPDLSRICPWVSAVVGGHIGKLSYIDRFPSLKTVMETLGNKLSLFQGNMLYGSFNKIMSRVTEECRCHNFNWHPQGTHVPFLKMFVEAVRFGLHEAVEIFIEHLGKYAGSYIIYLHKTCGAENNLLSIACSQRDNFKVVEPLLKSLFDCSQCEFSREFAQCVRLGELIYAQTFVRTIPNVFEKARQDYVILQCAIQSKNPQMVDYTLSLLGTEGPEECFQPDQHHMYPLYTAFASGCSDVICESSLLEVASKSQKFYHSLHPDWKRCARNIHGWFNILMKNNSKEISASHLNMESTKITNRPLNSLLSLRNKKWEGEHGALEMLHMSTTYQCPSMTKSILSACGGILSIHAEGRLVEILLDILTDPTSKELLNAIAYRKFFYNSISNRELIKLLRKFNKRCGFEDNLISLLSFPQIPGDDSEIWVSTFLSACRLGKAKVIDHILSVIKYPFLKSNFQDGMSLAIDKGHTEIAADLRLRMDISKDMKVIHNPVHRLIFSGEGYYKILDEFFSSISNSDQRMPLAFSWIVHNWSEKEAQLLVKTFSSTYAPSNPWVLSVQSSNVTITVDWDSFSESLLTSPSVEGLESKFRYTPLLVEAMVFSQAIMGQLITPPNTKSGFQNTKAAPNIFSESPNISSLIISCGVWPSPPSFSSFETQGILTLSYKPSVGTFVFPDPSPVTIENKVSFISDSLSSMFNSRCLNLIKYYEVILQKIVLKKFKSCEVIVHLSDSILNANSYEKMKWYHVLISTYLEDITEALNMALKPAVLYAKLRQHPINNSGIILGNDIDTLCIHFEVDDDGVDWSTLHGVEVSLEGSVLNLRIMIPCTKHNLEAPDVFSQATYSKLTDDLVDCILIAEVYAARDRAEEEIGRKLVVTLKESLRVSYIPDDILTLAVKNKDGEVIKFRNINLQFLENMIYMKSLVKLKRFLCLFCRMLRVFVYKPRLQQQVIRLFEAGFQVIIRNFGTSQFSVKMGVPHLTVSVPQLFSSSNSMLDIFQQVLSSCSSVNKVGSKSGNAFPPLAVPAPFACFFDLTCSNGLLYPVIGKPEMITVQLVNYSGHLINSEPSTVCCLEIKIKHLESGSMTSASSSHNPSPRSASKLLLIRGGDDGAFKIEWIPKKSGLHLISVWINQIAIMGSPYKSFASVSGTTSTPIRISAGSCGLRQTTTDLPFVFVVSHSTFPCDISKPPFVLLRNRKPIKAPRSLSSRDNFVQQLQSDKRSVHHISMCSAYNGAKNWLRLSNTNVSIHISQDDTDSKSPLKCSNFELTAVPLGKGFHRVRLSSTFVGSFSVFASCTSCQSVLKILWKDGGTVLPTSLYVVPGSLSLKYSTLRASQPRNQRDVDKNEGILCVVRAGSSVEITLKARDKHNNQHTTGGAVKDVTIRGGGRRRSSQTEDVKCNVYYKSNGKYIIQCQLFASGSHDIVVTDSCLKSAIFGRVKVYSGHPHGENCQLVNTNVYEATIGIQYSLSVELFDEFKNPTRYRDDYMIIRITDASVGREVLIGYTGPCAYKYGLTSSPSTRFIIFSFLPRETGLVSLHIKINGTSISTCPLPFNVNISMDSLKVKLKKLKGYLAARYRRGYTPTLTIDRSRLLESAVEILQDSYFSNIVRIRFGDEIGVDIGGISREFFHLLSLEFVNPNFALFQCVNGLYRPNPQSSANENHLYYFRYFGKILAKVILFLFGLHYQCISYLLKKKCTLDDLSLEEPNIYNGLKDILACETDEELELITDNFTATISHFGLTQKVELGQDGEKRKVTMENKKEFVHMLYQWYLIDSISSQLESMLKGFNSLVPPSETATILPAELEIILSGQRVIDIAFIRRKTKYSGYSSGSKQVKWLWKVLTKFSPDEKSKFLQFATGSGCLPIREVESWEFWVKKGSEDSSHLPEASTCFNSIRLPLYDSMEQLESKILLAILHGSQNFLQH